MESTQPQKEGMGSTLVDGTWMGGDRTAFIARDMWVEWFPSSTVPKQEVPERQLAGPTFDGVPHSQSPVNVQPLEQPSSRSSKWCPPGSGRISRWYVLWTWFAGMVDDSARTVKVAGPACVGVPVSFPAASMESQLEFWPWMRFQLVNGVPPVFSSCRARGTPTKTLPS